MKLNKDFEEFFELLNKNKVRFVVIGGYAVIFHGYPRFTGDIDIFFDVEASNINALEIVLSQFGFNLKDLNAKQLMKLGQVIQLGNPPNRIDLINSPQGITFKEVWESKVEGKYGKERVFYIHLDHLLKNKMSANREKDRGDIAFFRKKKTPDY